MAQSARLAVVERWARTDALTRDLAVLGCSFALLRVWAVAARPPVRWPDSWSYFYVDLLGHAKNGGRLWTVPLLYTSLGSDGQRVLAQLVIGIVCWIALAAAVGRNLQHPVVARVGAALVLLLGSCIQVTSWDQILLSESLALSLTVLVAALLLRLRVHHSWRLITALLIALVLWNFTRQLHVLVYVLVATFAIIWIVLRARRYLPVAVALAVIGIWAGYATAQDTGHVEYGAHDIVVMRMLQTADGEAFLKASGMPFVDRLQREAAAWAATHRYVGGASRVYQNPRWQRWVDRHWTWTYARWLLRRPVATLREPLSEAPALLDGFPQYGSSRPALPSPVQDALWDRSQGSLPLWLAVVVGAVLVARRRPRLTSLETIALLGIAISLVWYLLTWQLQASELARLTIPAALGLRVSLLVLLLASLDRVAARRTRT